jgi:hypothetical protein
MYQDPNTIKVIQCQEAPTEYLYALPTQKPVYSEISKVIPIHDEVFMAMPPSSTDYSRIGSHDYYNSPSLTLADVFLEEIRPPHQLTSATRLNLKAGHRWGYPG